MRVLLIGAGGHAQVVADVLLRMRDAGAGIEVAGYVDDNRAFVGKEFLGLLVRGSIAQVPEIPHEAVIVAIGDNQTRRRVFAALRQQGESFVVARHPSSIVAPDVFIGPGTVICAGAVVNPGTWIGANVILNTACSVDHHNHIGDHAHIAPGVHLGGDVTIGEGTLVGIGSTVMPQRSVGEWSVVSAGALIHSHVGSRVVAAGAPARVIRDLRED